MKKDIELIRNLIEEFMEKYNCTVKVETASYGYTSNGRLAYPKARFIINS